MILSVKVAEPREELESVKRAKEKGIAYYKGKSEYSY